MSRDETHHITIRKQSHKFFCSNGFDRLQIHYALNCNIKDVCGSLRYCEINLTFKLCNF